MKRMNIIIKITCGSMVVITTQYRPRLQNITLYIYYVHTQYLYTMVVSSIYIVALNENEGK